MRLSCYCILAVIFIAPSQALIADDETVSGTINGLRCVTEKIKCPVDANDPVIESLADFVLDAGDGSFFYLHNVGTNAKEGLVLKDVRVTGTVDRRYRSIEASEIEVRSNGDYQTVWRPVRGEEDYKQPGSSRR